MAEPFLREITPGNLLSFGPNPEPIKLNQLNILIGANGSGKSNLIEVIHVLRSTPGDLRSAFRPGISDWVWKGNPTGNADIDAVLNVHVENDQKLLHLIRVNSENLDRYIVSEWIADAEKSPEEYYYTLNEGTAVLVTTDDDVHEIIHEQFIGRQSVLSQRQDPKSFPHLYYLSNHYKRVRVYREWQFGRNSTLRQPQATDLRHEILEEDFSNLAMHLNYLRSFPPVRRKLIEKLQNVFAGITDFDVSVVGGTAQLYLIEGDYRIPATRLSDGTLRYLCLLAILCNPEPQPLICLEEPELGLHPDLLSGIVDMIRECSERTQLIVTTHSENIVDAFSNDPESVLVCEKEDGITTMKRLSSENLAVWLKDYSLGQLWSSGEIGGTRW